MEWKDWNRKGGHTDQDKDELPTLPVTAKHKRPLRRKRLRSHHRRRDPNGPIPRPSNSFMLYRRDAYPCVIAHYSNRGIAVKNSVISRIVALMWKRESERVRNIYFDRANLERERWKAGKQAKVGTDCRMEENLGLDDGASAVVEAEIPELEELAETTIDNFMDTLKSVSENVNVNLDMQSVHLFCETINGEKHQLLPGAPGDDYQSSR
ncbi:hypothetical protein HDU93_002664, partial [Gonapodya sp. JEL0774]